MGIKARGAFDESFFDAVTTVFLLEEIGRYHLDSDRALWDARLQLRLRGLPPSELWSAEYAWGDLRWWRLLLASETAGL